MAKKRLAIIIAVLFIFSMFPISAFAANVSLTLSADSAQAGDSISASGTAAADTLVSVKVLGSTQGIVFFDAVKSDSNGNYTCTFKVPSVSAGNFTVIAGYGSNVASKLLAVSTSGSGATAAVTGVSLKKTSTSIVKGASATLFATVAPANAANKAVTWSSNKEAVATVDGNGKVMAVDPGTATIQVMTADGNKTASCVVTVTKPETASSGGTIVVTADTPVTITVPQGVTSTITVTQNTDLPLIEVKSNMVDMIIPSGTQVNGSDTIKLPEVMPSSSVNVAVAQQVDLVIKVGSDLGTITFSNPVRLVLKGQGTKSAGFIDNKGQFQVISKLASLKGLASDADVDAAALALSNAGVTHGAVASDNDLIVWTKHFTQFVAYTPVEVAYNPIVIPQEIPEYFTIDPSGQTITSSGGILSEAGATVRIPVAAISDDIKVSIKKVSTGSIPAVSSEYKLVSAVYKITKDKDGNFAKAVTITLPFDRSKVDKDKEEVAIYCWKDSQWVVLKNIKVDMTTGKAKGDVEHFSIFAALAKAKAVTAVKVSPAPISEPIAVKLSDISGHWAEANIKQLAAAGAIGGNPDGSFKPNNYITRAEFATILVKAFKLTPKSGGKIFNDTAIHWAKDSISTVAAYGIVSGYSATTFGPNDLITREQMAVMIVKAAGCNAKGGKAFADSDQIADWAKAAVDSASANNILGGYPDNTFKPKANTTKAEAVTAIVKALR